jgi:hypothetical protein
MENFFIAVVLSLVLFCILYGNLPFIQSKEYKEMKNDEDDIWDRWN